jgi:hypothetical protein
MVKVTELPAVLDSVTPPLDTFHETVEAGMFSAVSVIVSPGNALFLLAVALPRELEALFTVML